MVPSRRAVLAGAGALAAAAAQGLPCAQAAEAARVRRLDPALDALIAPGTPVTRVATGFTFVEGPMWRRGRLWFSDLGADRMCAVTPGGRVSVLLRQAGGYPRPWPIVNLGSNAMAPDRDGTVLMCRQGGRTIVRVDGALQVHPFLSGYHGRRFNSPNDLVFHRDGALWFTDPPFGLPRMDQDPGKALPFNAVFRYAGGELTPVLTDFTLPNGIGFSPDWRTLYVSNYGPKMYVKAFGLGPGGRIEGERTLIAYDGSEGPGGPDGLKVDRAGRIWSTGPGGIRILTPQGRVLGQIVLPEVAANLAFAEDGRSVYIAASTSLYHLRTRTPGELPLYA
jgi:gluconolactonase